MSGTPWRVGLTGGIGSGKSTVAAVWAAMGAQVIDADALARQLTSPGGRGMAPLIAHFGLQCADATGGLDRHWMRAHAFSHPEARQALEGILHPLIGQAIAAEAKASRAPCLVFDIPLLVESPRWRPQLDLVAVVDCTRDTQVLRVQQRNAWARDQIERIIDQQATRQQRLQAADLVICNEGLGLEALRALAVRCAERFGLSSQD